MDVGEGLVSTDNIADDTLPHPANVENNPKNHSLPPKRNFQRTQVSKCRELLDKICP